jgi:hypothetical protein
MHATLREVPISRARHALAQASAASHASLGLEYGRLAVVRMRGSACSCSVPGWKRVVWVQLGQHSQVDSCKATGASQGVATDILCWMR